MNTFLNNAEKIAEIMKNFSNKDKIAILCFLWDDKKNVSEIMKCSSLSQSQISQYLGKMKLEWILESEKSGKEVYYKIADLKILEVIKALKLIFNK